MAMGFLDKLFGKKEEEKPLVLSLEEVKPWLEDKIREAEKEALDRLGPSVGEVENSRDTAKEAVLGIRDYEFPPDIKKKMYKPVLTSKPTYAKAMLDGLGTIHTNEAKSIKELEEYHKTTLGTMKAIQKTQLGKGRYMLIAFREDMLRIGTALNSIIDTLNSLGEGLEEEKKKLSRLRELNSKTDELNRMAGTVRRTDKKGEDEEIRGLMRKREAAEEKLTKLLKSGEYGEWVKAQKKLESIKKETGGHMSRIVNSFAPLARVFRKYKKLVEEGGVKGDIRVLEGYLQDPVAAFVNEDPGCNGIKSILRAVQESMEQGLLQLNEKERSKVLGKVRADLQLIDGLKAEVMETVGVEKRLTEALAKSKMDEKKKTLEEEQRTLEGEIKRRENEKLNTAEEAEKAKSDAQKIAAEISQALGEIEGKAVRVELPVF